jgi:ribosomal protein S18 acetylase RimI-like enzyme
VFNQFAVDPRYQRRGVGTAMMKHLEAVAARRGLEELACDTAEGAIHLVEWYRRMGYREVGRADWKDTNYQSLILSKRLNGG